MRLCNPSGSGPLPVSVTFVESRAKRGDLKDKHATNDVIGCMLSFSISPSGNEFDKGDKDRERPRYATDTEYLQLMPLLV